MEDTLTLAFEAFWSWLTTHPNCIVRAGTPEAVLYDDDDLHWHFASEGSSTRLVQVLRGKRLLGELLVEPEEVTYVQGSAGDEEGEFLFELIAENETEQAVSWFFVLSHGFDSEGGSTPGRVH
jgi:hypothetical protein